MPWAHWIDPQNRLTQAQRYFYLAGLRAMVLRCIQFRLSLLSGGGRCHQAGFVAFYDPAHHRSVDQFGLHFHLSELVAACLGDSQRAETLLGFGIPLDVWHVQRGMGGHPGQFPGSVQSKTAFLRTPKTMGKVRVLNALFATQWEAGIGTDLPGNGGRSALADCTHPTLTSSVGCSFWQSSLYLVSPIYGVFYKSCD